MRGETSQPITQLRQRHGQPVLKLIEHPQHPMAPQPFSFCQPPHGRIPGEQYRSLRLGKRERVAVVDGNLPLEGPQPLRLKNLFPGQRPDLQAQNHQLLPARIPHFILVERIRNDKAIRQGCPSLNASLQVLLLNSSAMYNTGVDALPSIPRVAGFFWSPSLNG